MKTQEYKHFETQLRPNIGYEAESIEQKLRRATTTNEPIEAVSAELYTERKDGVQPQYDIRTDRFDIALEAQTKAEKIQMTQREENPTANAANVEQNKTE